MPLVFGAVHRQYAATDDPATELADLVEAAHALDIEVWLDVVLNHTTEADRTGPTYSLRALADASTTWSTTTACTSTTPARATSSTPIRRRRGASIMEALDRLADLGVDGFRFDLASGARS